MSADRTARDTAEVIHHYEALLAEHYTWMSGGFAAKVSDQTALLKSLGPIPSRPGRAVDLGCGPGFQAVALADLGYQVTAVDLSPSLLAELERHRTHRAITIVEADIRSIAASLTPGFSLAVCMGDTLPHLPSTEDVWRLFADVFRLLAPGGRLVLSYRDLSIPLTGPDRFIPVRSDTDRVMTCFLEYEPEAVVVHDLIHVRGPEGWTLHKGCYRKLRLPGDEVGERLTRCGFHSVQMQSLKGLSVIVAERP